MANTLNFAIFLTLSVFAITLAKKPSCIWYGECNTNENNLTQNCPTTKPARRLNDVDALSVLKNRCPNLFENNEVEEFCCDAAQVRTMDRSIGKAAAVFQRCPTCQKNLEQHICQMTCAPDHSRFMKVLALDDQETYITSVEIRLTERYMNATFESCMGVITPATQQLVMDAACGSKYNAMTCTAQRWFKFMGDMEENMETPFELVYNSNANMTADHFLDPTGVLTCDEAYEGSVACSCVDCELTCPTGLAPNFHVDRFTVLGMNGVSFVTSLVIFILGILMVLIYAFIALNRSSSAKEVRNGFHDEDATGPECLFKMAGSKLNGAIENFFRCWGYGMASHPTLVLMITTWVIIGLGYGATKIQVTTDPVELWAAPESRSRLEKDYFDSHFRPFYRTEQIFFKTVGLPKINHTIDERIEFGPAFNKTFLKTIFELQQRIEAIGLEDNTGLDRICFAPLASAFTGPVTVSQCTVESPFGFFQNDMDAFENEEVTEDGTIINYLNTLTSCMNNIYYSECMAPYGGPIEPALVFGGYSLDGDTLKYHEATGVVITFIVNNEQDKNMLENALSWEKSFIKLLKEWKEKEMPDYMDMAFSSERSIEDELSRESEAEVSTVVISYVVMFIYITIALGHIRSWKTFFIDTKIMLGIGGIATELSSILCSLGIFGYIGVPTTLLTIEVLPFLVLAVGIDNIFILVQTHQRTPTDKSKSREEEIGDLLANVGPTMLLTSLSECACFALGALADMPAVRTFAMYAAVALLIDFFLQITAFIAIMTIDDRRHQDKRFDIMCCVKVKHVPMLSDEKKGRGWLFRIWGKYYVPFLMKNWVRGTVLVLFLFWTCASIAVIPSIEPGLDQELSMPEDSHVLTYFQYMNELLSIGPPIYWVVKSDVILDYSKRDLQDVLCGGKGCSADSISTQLYIPAKYPETTYIARPASSWIDDYMDWSTLPDICCQYFQSNDSFCPHNINDDDCKTCNIELTTDLVPRPTEEAFKYYLPYFLQDNPDSECAKGGHPAYASSLNYIIDDAGDAHVKEYYLMSYHTVLKTSKDYYHALRYARKIADNLTATIQNKTGRIHVEIFPYSVFYVYYEQYLTIWEDALTSLGISLMAVFVVTLLVTGFSCFSALVVLLLVFIILVNISGCLYWWNITLNAVSVVNLVMAVGIAVEFCSNIVHAFRVSEKVGGVAKAADALANMGSSVLSGITLTKFFGIVVLAFAKSQIFQIFYFRMYMCIVIVGATHGLILLPVILSVLG